MAGRPSGDERDERSVERDRAARVRDEQAVQRDADARQNYVLGEDLEDHAHLQDDVIQRSATLREVHRRRRRRRRSGDDDAEQVLIDSEVAASESELAWRDVEKQVLIDVEEQVLIDVEVARSESELAQRDVEELLYDRDEERSEAEPIRRASAADREQARIDLALESVPDDPVP